MREEKRLDWIISREDKLETDMLRALDRTRKFALDEAKKWAADYVENEKVSLNTAIKRVSIDDMNRISKQAKKLVKDKNFSPEANKILKRYNFGMRMSRADALMFTIDEALIKLGYEFSETMGEYLTNKTIKEMMEQAGILGLNIPDSDYMRRAADSIVSESFHGTTFSETIWKNQGILRNQIEQGLLKSLLLGQHPTKWMKNLDGQFRDAFKGSKYALKRLAVTEAARVQSQAQKRMYNQGGYSKYEFMAESTACPICAKLDGQIFEVKTLMPGINAAPIHPHCRCSTAASYSEEEYRELYDKLLQDIEDGIAPEDLIPEEERKAPLTPNEKRLSHSKYYPDEIHNLRDGEFKVKRGKPMTFEEADNGRANPRFSMGGGYRINCQSTVVAHEARLRGYDVSAIPNTKNSPAYKLSKDVTTAWTNRDGTQPKLTPLRSRSPIHLKKVINDYIVEDERYHMVVSWKRSGAHIINLEKANNKVGFKIYDPQTNKRYESVDEIDLLFSRFSPNKRRPSYIIRVDDKLFNMDVVDKVLQAREEMK